MRKRITLFLLTMAMAIMPTAQVHLTTYAETKEVISAHNTVDFSKIPDYSGTPYVEINGNLPFLNRTDGKVVFETYSELDDLGRCQVAYANICKELMPTEERGAIGSVKPTGWHTANYHGLIPDGNYLYNRCHLIGYQLAGENANEKNLITGTRYLNVEGMLPFENHIDDYVERTGHHVLYRVTPVFEEKELVARGVLMEAQSVEDDNCVFCIYCYNVQPGIVIDYATGDSVAEDGTHAGYEASVKYAASTTSSQTQIQVKQEEEKCISSEETYILNTSTKKIHRPACSSASKISAQNRKETTESKNSLLSQGYSRCKICNP